MNNHQLFIVCHRSTIGTLLQDLLQFLKKKKREKVKIIIKKRLARHKKILPFDPQKLLISPVPLLTYSLLLKPQKKQCQDPCSLFSL